ncbi:MAG: tRNA pseudouridine(38-40) synthase TruA [Candidatus Eremiobacteraeota bacterium]|nr:tRNA pseudouridine(38-40) synthase TruA [Candidatus Eremiobacteraeota bacterium]MBV8366363.1 tRNA pseudouridine(38-40) synthase TruA [Candidatus Eremiobacteraeota bacterium]
MRTIALVIEYDGARFHGFQRQPELRTVAGELEKALPVLCGAPVEVVGAGRTDAGVHATGQVVSFETSYAGPLERWPIALAGILRGSGIAVLRAVEREHGFSARYDALARTYQYRILNRQAPSPLLRGRALFVRAPLDLAAMAQASTTLLGEHDFTSFCAQVPERGRPLRAVESLAIERSGDIVELTITADSFLHQMVRIIAGTLIDIGRGRRSADDMASILAARDRAAAGATAPAHALYLTHVRYAQPL